MYYKKICQRIWRVIPGHPGEIHWWWLPESWLLSYWWFLCLIICKQGWWDYDELCSTCSNGDYPDAGWQKYLVWSTLSASGMQRGKNPFSCRLWYFLGWLPDMRRIGFCQKKLSRYRNRTSPSTLKSEKTPGPFNPARYFFKIRRIPAICEISYGSRMICKNVERKKYKNFPEIRKIYRLLYKQLWIGRSVLSTTFFGSSLSLALFIGWHEDYHPMKNSWQRETQTGLPVIILQKIKSAVEKKLGAETKIIDWTH